MSAMGFSAFDEAPGARGKVFLLGVRGWLLILLLSLLAGFGVAILYSIGGDPTSNTPDTPLWQRGSWDPWAAKHAIRYAAGLLLMFVVALAPTSWWRNAAYPAYFIALALLLGVELFGETAMGATRWLDIGPVRLQPSEIMKLAVVVALARYYHDLDFDKARGVFGFAHIPAFALIAMPVALIAKQPDLGTALLVTAAGAGIVFLSGIRWTHIFLAGVAGSIGMAGLFAFGLHDYQRRRILTFLDPDADPMGAGYHVLQSKIAIGSGGIDGKGFGLGTQTQLDFLPEKHTDFVFTVIGEELGFVGGAALLALVAAILVVSLSIALSCRHQFGRLAALGAVSTFAFYVIINVAMVMGVVPVVGVPLPLVSYGGTVMLVVLASFGLVLSVHLHRDEELSRGRGMFF